MFVYSVRNILVYDLYLIVFFLWWYQIILWNGDKIVVTIYRECLISMLYFYARYFVVKKKRIIGIIFNIILFSTPFFFYYFFDQRSLGIILINIVLSVLLIARIFYIKTIKSPAFAFKITLNGLSIKYCDLYFTAVATLLQYEIDIIRSDLTRDDNWIVYLEYEKHRDLIREMIITDLAKMNATPEDYFNIVGLEEDLTRYYELAEIPFLKDNFIRNKLNLLDYERVENRKAIDSEPFEGIEYGLVANNEIEVRTKNPTK